MIWAALRFPCDLSEYDVDVPPVIFKLVIIAIGVLFIAFNIPDLISPQGIAIHQLIKDVRG